MGALSKIETKDLLDWFAKQLITWHAHAGRSDLPWQQDINPYRIWVSEIMLQQTQVATVIDYYQRFMQRFPTIRDLGQANVDEVLHLWTGLGYYARGRNLLKTAQLICTEHGGKFPTEQAELEALPGIGRSTAGAIRAISMGQHAAILDGNVKRVLTRFHAISGYPGTSANQKILWAKAETHTPDANTATYTQAIMDLGATVCVRKNPACPVCPLNERCEAKRTDSVARYPEAKPKKDKPTKRARFFIVTLDNGMTLLERRPANGLWGGLWNPLERDADFPLSQLLTDLGLQDSKNLRNHQAPTFRHTFTHFHLEVEPIYVFPAISSNLLEDSEDRRWVQHKDLGAGNNPIGLSAVAVKLLAALHEQNHD